MRLLIGSCVFCVTILKFSPLDIVAFVCNTWMKEVCDFWNVLDIFVYKTWSHIHPAWGRVNYMRIFIINAWIPSILLHIIFTTWDKHSDTHTNRQIVPLNQAALIHSETAVLLGSSESLAEHACRKPHVLACCILLAGHAETAGTENRQMKEFPSYPAALTDTTHSVPPTTTVSGLPSCTKLQNKHPPRNTLWQSNPRSFKHFCTREEPALQHQEHHLTERVQRQTGGETAGRTQKIQTGNPKEERQRDKKEKKEQAERPQSLQEKLCVLAVCDSMKIVDVPEEGSRCFICGTAQGRQETREMVGTLAENKW